MLYDVQNPMQQAMGGMNQAAGTYGRMMPNIPANQKPGPTAGGAVMSGLGAAGTVASIGSMLGPTSAMGAAMTGSVGLGVGALIGIGSYLFS